MKKIFISLIFVLFLVSFGCIDVQSSTYVCPDGTTVTNPMFCTANTQTSSSASTTTKYVCSDGTVVSDQTLCPVAGTSSVSNATGGASTPTVVYVCPDGSNATSLALCKKYVCSDGSTVSLPSMCNSTSSASNVSVSTTPSVIYICPDGSNATSLALCPKYVCANGSVVSAPGLCTAAPVVANTTINTTNSTANLTMPACNSSNSVYQAITTNLLTKSNECRSARVQYLCSKCSTCCEAGGVTAKTEYAQSLDATCYSCAATNFNVSRARDYYDRMGNYSKICTPMCTSTLVPAYKAYLQYGKDNSCTLSSGWQICDDVTIE